MQWRSSPFSLDPTNADSCRVLLDELPLVSAGDWDWLEQPLTLAQFSEVLHLMLTNKSLVICEMAVMFYRTFWDMLDPDLATVWAKTFAEGGRAMCSSSAFPDA